MTRRDRRRPTRRLAIAALVVVVALGASACGDDEGDTPEAGEEVGGRVPTTVADEDDGATSSDGTATDSTGSTDSTTTTAAADAPGPLADVEVVLEPFLEAEMPVKLVPRPGSDLLYVAQKTGRVLAVDPAAPTTEVVALDLSEQVVLGNEQGLLGLAFSADGATLYVHHSGLEGETRVASFAMDGDVADPASRVDLLTVDQPFPNHNGGDILLGPDGMLWIGLGDGGAADDPDERAQDPDDLLGKILRIDPTSPSAGQPYGIPDGNMFAAGEGRPEIVVVGVRNPWRMRFDEATGDLWVADVGQDRIEEVDRLPAGQIVGTNLGWSRWEGSEVFLRGHALGPGANLGPVYETLHDDGFCSITGGVMYRGTAIADLAGAYLFGDYCQPGLFSLRLDGDEVGEDRVLDAEVSAVVSIDADADGEVYVLSLDGTIFRLTAA